MANIKVVVEKPIADGYKLKFRTPCGSNAIEGLDVKYPAKNGVGTLIKKFVFKDAHGTELSGVGNLFVGGVMIEVLLDVTHGVAYIKNADTNSYVEKEIDAIRKSHIQFWDVASKAVDEAKERAESVQGIYVGGGDMPEGYSVQIDPDGDAIVVDMDLDETSNNPVANKVVVEGLTDLRTDMEENIMTNLTNFKDGFGVAVYKASNRLECKQLISNPEYEFEDISGYHLFAFCVEDITQAPSDFAATMLVPVCTRMNNGVDIGTASMSVGTGEFGVVDCCLTAKFDGNKITIESFTATTDEEPMFAARVGITGIWAIA